MFRILFRQEKQLLSEATSHKVVDAEPLPSSANASLRCVDRRPSRSFPVHIRKELSVTTWKQTQ